MLSLYFKLFFKFLTINLSNHFRTFAVYSVIEDSIMYFDYLKLSLINFHIDNAAKEQKLISFN